MKCYDHLITGNDLNMADLKKQNIHVGTINS